MSESKQRSLDPENIAEFYHDKFVSDQVNDFGLLLKGKLERESVVADIGGGYGYFASAIAHKYKVQSVVLDMDPQSIAACKDRNQAATLFDALNPGFRGDEDIVAFNLVLHHLVGKNERVTREMQMKAIRAWKDRAELVFVNEYIYDAFLIPTFSAKVIWQVTSSRLLSQVAAAIAKYIPALRANTFGIGVRFRTKAAWESLFNQCGFSIIGYIRGKEEHIGWARRLLLIRSIRRDSFLLKAVPLKS